MDDVSKVDGLRPEQLQRMAKGASAADRETLESEMVRNDVQAVLSLPGALRVFGRIIARCRVNEQAQYVSDHAILAYNAGFRDAGLMIADTIRGVDPRLLAECEIAHDEFVRMFNDLADDGEEES